MTYSLAETVAAEVRAEMARQRKSQKDLSDALGIAQPAISLRLSGKRAFKLRDLEALAALFGVPVTRFFPSERAA